MSVKSLSKKKHGYTETLQAGEDPFSTNRVTGHSLNVPIIGTCMPTEVCGITCYFAKGPSTWTASLKKQHRLLNSIRSETSETAARIVKSAKKKKMTFVRWNGGGDLVEESLQCIDEVATAMPTIPQWIVTRKPELASRVTPRDNVYVHFSVDRASWPRLDAMRSLAPKELQWFHSYQCDKGELPPSDDVAPVIFRHNYDLNGSQPVPKDCPLNTSESIVGVCESCRRCFNGDALRRAKECHSKQRSPSPS